MTAHIRPMLACSDTILTCDNYDQITYPVIASTKLDGWRCLIDTNSNGQSRSGKHIPNQFTRNEIKAAGLAGFDGELLASASTDPNAMQKAQSAFSSTYGEPDFTYHVFDNWKRGNIGFHAHMEALKSSEQRLPEWARLIPQIIITTAEELAMFVNEATAQGYEGAITRSFNSPYKHGRSTWNQGWMLKAKGYVYEEATIIGFKEKMHNFNVGSKDELGFHKRSGHKSGKAPANTVGSFEVQNQKYGKFFVGTGSLSHAELQVIWDYSHPSAWMGKIITFKHFAQTGVVKLPRHAQFVTLRSTVDLGE